MGFGYNFLTVQLSDGRVFDIPFTHDSQHPERTRIGPIPDAVLVEYELVTLPIQFLLRRDRSPT